jgi:hypothetical protein
MKFRGKIAILTLFLTLVLVTGSFAAMERAQFINGNQWTQWSNLEKLVYIRGVCNWADFITQAQSQRWKTTHEFSMSKVFVDQLKNKSLGEIVSNVDAYYQNNPNNLNTSVIEVVLRRCTNVCPQ